MSSNGSAIPTEATEVQDKGKGKSVEEPSRTIGMEEDEDEEESGLDEVSSPPIFSTDHCANLPTRLPKVNIPCCLRFIPQTADWPICATEPYQFPPSAYKADTTKVTNAPPHHRR